jgi:hypothetical protein
MLAVFGRIDPHLRRSITFANDTAFAQHGLLRTMRDMTTWFCDAYASWQKGGIENANGRLPRWLPRHLDIDRTSDREIQEIVLTTNLTPRKCLGFKTPFQALLPSLERTSKYASLNLVAFSSGIQALLTTCRKLKVGARTPYATPENGKRFWRCIERLDIKVTLGAATRRARVSGVQLFPSGCRHEFPTIDSGQNLSSARLEL